jgi:hypothetical protein
MWRRWCSFGGRVKKREPEASVRVIFTGITDLFGEKQFKPKFLNHKSLVVWPEIEAGSQIVTILHLFLPSTDNQSNQNKKRLI